ncbi:hypothetical protein NLC29_04100 [Candidatus Aminicenantes bacterium AH-873-B07]|jgi:hypothetical protein|nr:hypothetical protein [Candidatus Aminicenantes bacterium AH-873-B07]
MFRKYIVFIILLIYPYLLFANFKWKISLWIKVNGTYEIKDKSWSIKGEYYLFTEWEGIMEKDNSDFLLYKGNGKIIKWEGKETVHNPNNFLFNKITDLSNCPPPKLKVNYLLRRNNLVNLDFNFSPFFVPVGEPKIKRKLLMPCSAQNEFLNPEIKYNKNILSGTNRVCFKVEEIYNKILKKIYSWKWKRVEVTFRKNKPLTFTNFHSVNVKLKIKISSLF